MNNKILIIEDEADIALLLKAQIESQGHQAEIAYSGLIAKDMINSNMKFDLFLVDWMLPNLTGIEVCKFIRSNSPTKETPIIMVTALTQAENIIEGLDSGADDYITKPFDMDILLARVRAQLRRKESSKNPNLIQVKDLIIDLAKCSVKIQNTEISLTHTEFRILSLLAKESGKVFTREQLIKIIIGQDVHVTNRTIDTHVAGLRKKLGLYSEIVKTIRGIGYRFIDIN